MLGSKYLQPLCACLLNTKQRLLELASNKKRIQTSHHKASCKKFTYLNLCTFFLCHLTIALSYYFFGSWGRVSRKYKITGTIKSNKNEAIILMVDLNTATIIADRRTNED